MPLRVRLRALYLALGLKPIVQVLTVCPSALLVKFVGALPNLLLNRDQDGRLVGLRCECEWLFARSRLDGDLPFSPVVQSAVPICRLLVRFFAMPTDTSHFGQRTVRLTVDPEPAFFTCYAELTSGELSRRGGALRQLRLRGLASLCRNRPYLCGARSFGIDPPPRCEAAV